MLDETRRSRGHLSYSIKGELFGEDYRQQLPYHLIFSCHVLQSWTIPYGSILLLAAARRNFSRPLPRRRVFNSLQNQNLFFYFFWVWKLILFIKYSKTICNSMEIGCVICFFQNRFLQLYILAVKKAAFYNQVLLAQSVEREACNHGVGSSKLTQSTFDFLSL
jgi:hypothetical protein